MAFQTMWFDTCIPGELVDLIERDCRGYEKNSKTATVMSGIDLKVRDSKTSWIPDSHWVPNFCMSYILRANKDNWQYNIDRIDGGEMQYTIYEQGQYYNWHQDAGIEALDEGSCRKLSVVLQLSNPEEYEGGEFQILNEAGNMYIAPKRRGTLIVFDSRARHRVRKIHSGTRKSLVGWVVGPRWK
jgi:PKHD-type hydroxylase